MDFQCPLCNALIEVKENCPQCGGQMDDYGPVEDYFAPYNPYLDRDIVSMGQPEHQCIHLFACQIAAMTARMVKSNPSLIFGDHSHRCDFVILFQFYESYASVLRLILDISAAACGS